MKLFDTFISFVASWEFKVGEKSRQIPSHNGWLLALKGLKGLCHQLMVEEKALSFLCLRKVNQDHVENLHSQIRRFNGFNDHPMPEQYVNALHCLACYVSTTELLDKNISSGANCLPDGENDISLPLPQVNTGVCGYETETPEGHEIESTRLDWEAAIPLSLSDIEHNIVDYIAGSVVKQIVKNYSTFNLCKECISLLTKDPQERSGTNVTLVMLKEYKEGSLITVSVSDAVSELCNSFENFFQRYTKYYIIWVANAQPKETSFVCF